MYFILDRTDCDIMSNICIDAPCEGTWTYEDAFKNLAPIVTSDEFVRILVNKHCLEEDRFFSEQEELGTWKFLRCEYNNYKPRWVFELEHNGEVWEYGYSCNQQHITHYS